MKDEQKVTRQLQMPPAGATVYDLDVIVRVDGGEPVPVVIVDDGEMEE